jgi:hypothetical protein
VLASLSDAMTRCTPEQRAQLVQGLSELLAGQDAPELDPSLDQPPLEIDPRTGEVVEPVSTTQRRVPALDSRSPMQRRFPGVRFADTGFTPVMSKPRPLAMDSRSRARRSEVAAVRADDFAQRFPEIDRLRRNG